MEKGKFGETKFVDKSMGKTEFFGDIPKTEYSKYYEEKRKNKKSCY